MRNNTGRLTALALTVSFALILSFIESKLPPFVPIQGVKIGLANITVIFALYKLGICEAAAISAVRVVLVSLLFGNPMSFLYSIAGAVLSLAAMYVLKRFTPLTVVTVSIVGGIMHNVGQIGMASILLGTNAVVYYLPILIISGMLAGIAVGIASGLIIKKVNIDLSYIRKDK